MNATFKTTMPSSNAWGVDTTDWSQSNEHAFLLSVGSSESNPVGGTGVWEYVLSVRASDETVFLWGVEGVPTPPSQLRTSGAGSIDLCVALYAAGDPAERVGALGQVVVRDLDADGVVDASEIVYRTGTFNEFTGAYTTDPIWTTDSTPGYSTDPTDPTSRIDSTPGDSTDPTSTINSTPSSNTDMATAVLTTKSIALNVYSDATADDAQRALLKVNSDNEFEVAYDAGSECVRLPKVKYGDETDTLTVIIDAMKGVSSGLSVFIAGEKSRAEAKENALQSDIAAEESRASAAETVLSTRITNEQSAASNARNVISIALGEEVSTRAAAITAEALLRLEADTAHTNAIDQEVLDRIAGDTTNTNAIAVEAGLRSSGDTTNASAIAAEAETARAAELENREAIAALDLSTGTGVADEIVRAKAKEAELQQQISNILNNTDEVTLNSLSEIVADYQQNGVDHTAALNAQKLKQQTEKAGHDSRLDAIEALLEALQNAI